MSDITLDALAGEIRQRLDATDQKISDAISDVKLTDMIRGLLPSLLEENVEVVRKLRFGQPDPIGGKYARLGMTVSDVEFLHDLQTSLTGQRKVDNQGVYGGPSEELRNAFTAVSEGRYIDTAILRGGWERDYARYLADGRWTPEMYERAVRAMDTAESGYGSQLIGAQYVADLWRGARAQSRVFALLNSFEMQHPTAYLPVEANVPEVLYVSESTASNSSNFTTVKTGSNRVSVSASKFVIHQMWSGEMEEDSLIPFLPFLREEATRAVAHYSDSLVLNGDTTNAGTGNINLDDADPADTKHYLAFDGIRHAGLVDNTANSADIAGAITLNHFKGVRGRLLDTTYLHDWGHPTDPNDLVHVADPQTCDAISFLDEMLTVDKYGAGATVMTGEQAKVAGHPLISSIAVSKTEADGKVSTTAGNNVKGQVVSFNRRGAVVGWRRQVQLETERLPASDQTRLVYSMRLGLGRFSPTGAASGIEWADVAYNISL